MVTVIIDDDNAVRLRGTADSCGPPPAPLDRPPAIILVPPCDAAANNAPFPALCASLIVVVIVVVVVAIFVAPPPDVRSITPSHSPSPSLNDEIVVTP